MSTKLKSIIESYTSYWKQMENLKHGEGPYIHSEDIDHLSKYNDMWFRGKDASQYDPIRDKKKLHVDLLPSPYMGDILNAKIIILMGNPGIENPKKGYSSPAEYRDHENDALWNALVSTLKQDFSSEDMKAYPYAFLNPAFEKTAGGRYDKTMYKRCIANLDKEFNGEGKSILAKNICKFQFYPYHSGEKPDYTKAYPKSFLIDTPSYRQYKKFLIDYLPIVTKMPDKLIFVTRWGKYLDGLLQDCDNVLRPKNPRGVKSNFSKECYQIITDHIIKWS